MKIKHLFSVLVVLIIELLCTKVSAAPCGAVSSTNTIISSDCSNISYSGTTYPTGTLEISNGVTVSSASSYSVRIGAVSVPTTFGTFTNNGTIYTSQLANLFNIFGGATLDSLVNNGVINDMTAQIYNGVLLHGDAVSVNSGGTLNSLTNNGLLQSLGNGIHVLSGAGTSIGIITNNGTIAAGNGFWGILTESNANIATLNNLQGAGNTSGALTYKGVLPQNYNIIIQSLSNYGQLSVGTYSGSMSFGIQPGSTVNANGKYTSVLQGFSTLGSVTNPTGTFNSYGYSLVANTSQANAWDLCFGDCSVVPAPPPPAGPSTADTQASLVNTASSLQNIYTLQNSVLANSFSYDCTVFGASNVCISAGGRNTAVSAANGLNNTSGLLIAAYRPHQNYRIGAYADQNLSVNNTGSTVNLGNNTPLIGIFGAWNQRADDLGAEVKVSAAYGQKNTTITRSVVGVGSTASEAGTGGSQLNSQGAQVVTKYGFGVMQDTVVSPYAGVRYTQNNMGGYTESVSASVTAPLTYSALNTNATTALAGVGATYKGIPQTTLFASAGVETDTNTANGSYSATGVTGLTPVNFNSNPVKTRPTAMLGASYDVAKNQRLGISGIYRQEAYQAVQTATVLATYTVGL